MRLAIVSPLALGCLVLIAGCNGPTKAGIEAREQARARVGAFHSSFSYQQARSHFEAGDLEKALRHAELACAQAPTAAMFHVLKARILLEMHRLDEAERALVQALELDDDLSEAHYCRGILMQRWSRDEEALNEYRRARELAPSEPHHLLAEAEMLVALGRPAEAGELVEAELQRFENHPALQHFLARVDLIMGNADQASHRLLEARLLDPTNVALIEEHMLAQAAAGDDAGVLATYEVLAARGTVERGDLRRMRARALSRLGKTTDALRIYQGLLDESAYGDATLWIEYGRTAWEANDAMRVSQAGDALVRSDRAAPEGWLLLGAAELIRGRPEKALPSLREAAQRATDWPLPHLVLGTTLETVGSTGEAVDAYARAVAIDPACREAIAGRERALHSIAASADD